MGVLKNLFQDIENAQESYIFAGKWPAKSPDHIRIPFDSKNVYMPTIYVDFSRKFVNWYVIFTRMICNSEFNGFLGGHL